MERLNQVPEILEQLSRYAPAPVNVPDDIRTYVSRLKIAAAELGRRWRLGLRTEPGDMLGFLADYILSTTREDHFSDLALLVTVGHMAHGGDKFVTGEDVSKIVKRARKRRAAASDRT